MWYCTSFLAHDGRLIQIRVRKPLSSLTPRWWSKRYEMDEKGTVWVRGVSSVRFVNGTVREIVLDLDNLEGVSSSVRV